LSTSGDAASTSRLPIQKIADPQGNNKLLYVNSHPFGGRGALINQSVGTGDDESGTLMNVYA
jgi:hypothetical protein